MQGEKAYGAVATIMNEFGQVLDQFLCEGKSLSELEAGLQRLRDNYRRLCLEVSQKGAHMGGSRGSMHLICGLCLSLSCR